MFIRDTNLFAKQHNTACRSYVSVIHVYVYTRIPVFPVEYRFFGVINNRVDVESGTSRLDASSSAFWIQHAYLFCEICINIPDSLILVIRQLQSFINPLRVLYFLS